MKKISIAEISVLIIAYQRPANIKTILGKSLDSGVRNFYISLDFPASLDGRYLSRNQEIRDLVCDFAINNSVKVHLREFEVNVGCAVAVLRACDWFFSEVNYGIVLEDDCLPSADFFEFMILAFEVLQHNAKIMVATGSQLVNISDLESAWTLNNYPVFWGWGTLALNWHTIKDSISQNLPYPTHVKWKSRIESVYWQAGSRRIREGYVDTWDTLISQVFFLQGYFNLCPRFSLINNVGYDEVSSHNMKSLSTGVLNQGNFSNPISDPEFNPDVNKLIARHLYGFRLRHLFSTKVTLILDRLNKERQHHQPLFSRLAEADKYYCKMTIFDNEQKEI